MKKIYEFTDFIFSFPNSVSIELIEAYPDYYGIGFNISGIKYEIIQNIHLGSRLLIKEREYCLQDIPLNKNSMWLLPKTVEVVEKK